MGTGPRIGSVLGRWKPGRHERRRSVGGFTLMELLLCLVIIALAMAVTLPWLSGSSATELRSAARLLAAGLRSAREQAISSNQGVALYINVDTRQMAIVDSLGGAPDQTKVLPAEVGYKLFAARSELRGGSGGQIRFFPDGSSTGGRITVFSDAAVLLVDVDWLTGRIEILEGTRDDLSAAAGPGIAMPWAATA